MASKFDEFRAAVREAESTIAAAESVASYMAQLLRGRLRHVPSYVLVALKKELRNFNANTKEWNS